MPVYTAQIKLQNAFANDYLILDRELERRAFSPSKKVTRSIAGQAAPVTDAINVTRQAGFLHDITADIMAAAHKTGKSFTFTVIKNKS